MTKRKTLDDAASFAAMKATKPAAQPPALEPAAAVAAPAAKTLTLRLPPATWRHLRQMAVDRDTSMQAIMLEGLSLVLERHGRRPGGAA